MTQMTTTKAGPNLGARVEGLDLRAMTPEEVRELLAAQAPGGLNGGAAGVQRLNQNP